MLLNKKELLFIFAISITALGFSQNKNKVFIDTVIPKSIYLAKPDFLYFNSNFNLDKRIQLNNFKFVFLNVNDIEDGYYVIPFESFWNPPSSYIFDSYQEIYHNMNLKKSFFKVSKLYDVPYKPKK
jgi:hypothetical protein